MDGIRDWLEGLTRRERVLVVVIGLAALGGAGLWYVRSLPRQVEVSAPVPGPSASPSPVAVIVHVAGWVRSPGVYELREGDRVVDAIDAAGGPRKGAELGALNLAALLSDGQQVLVGRMAGPTTASTPGEAPGGSAAGQLINVNTATAAELEVLPGIGEVLAGTIVAYRDEHGPFGSVDQLEDVSGIGPVTLEEIRDLVTV
jgi:competence protein ComEA